MFEKTCMQKACKGHTFSRFAGLWIDRLPVFTVLSCHGPHSFHRFWASLQGRELLRGLTQQSLANSEGRVRDGIEVVSPLDIA